MQPLYSVDHESRHNTNHAEEDNVERSSEQTPLLHRFPQNLQERSALTTVVVSLLLTVLIAGVIIGIYLLVLQNNSENILPPVELPLQLVSRAQWDPSNLSQSDQKSFPYRLHQVTVVQTGTSQCLSTKSCTKLLQQMQANATAANSSLPYNFVISSNGQTYEVLGWQKTSPLFTPQKQSALLLAFIGNFMQVPPTRSQLVEAKNFIAASVSQQYLHPSYRIYGRNINETPKYLSQSLQVKFPQWSNEFSDRK